MKAGYSPSGLRYLAAMIGLALALAALGGEAFAVDLKFQYREGDRFRFYGESEQSVRLNGKALQTNSGTFRSGYAVPASSDGKAQLKGQITYTTSRKGAHSAAQASEALDVAYAIDELGRYSVAAGSALPALRDVPSFPGRAVEEEDTWSAPGTEVEDLSDIGAFSQNKEPLPLIFITFPVSYRYAGSQIKDGKTLQIIEIDYNLYASTTFTKEQYRVFPVLLCGKTHETLYFNNALGLEDSYSEEYSLDIVLSTGDVYEFSGRTTASLTEAAIMDRPQLEKEVKQDLAAQGLQDLVVKSADRGIVISLNSIDFPADSSELSPTEKAKLRLIGDVLKEYPDRDLLVEGFTAQAGSSDQQRRLSEERAASVGDYLLELGVREPKQIIYRGLGAKRPLAPNDTEENRRKNRRVEITILEN